MWLLTTKTNKSNQDIICSEPCRYDYEFAITNTFSLLIKSSHRVLRILLKWCCWIVRRFFIWWCYKVHVSQPYKSKGMRHWSYTLHLVENDMSCESNTRLRKRPYPFEIAWKWEVNFSFIEQSLGILLPRYLKLIDVIERVLCHQWRIQQSAQ